MARLFVSAAHKSSGKTTLCIGLAAALVRRGLSVQGFKKGPDYIDPMWLARASLRPVYNLDFNTQSAAEIRALFARQAAGADLALIEGNKGLHDGIDVAGSDSSAALAKLLVAPVVLVIDCAGITRGVAPLVLGQARFDTAVAVRGVILNRVSGARQEAKLCRALETYTDLPVLGAIGRDAVPAMPERHLGLVTPSETPASDEVVARLAATVAASVDLDRILTIARAAPALAAPDPAAAPAMTGAPVRIAIARDAAFGFYYPDDFEALRAAGAELALFDSLRDADLPSADGLFLGGGFPETCMDALAANRSLRLRIRLAAEGGMPIYAECGGLMYLTRGIAWQGQRHAMVGAVSADTVMRERPQGRGLVELAETDAMPWPDPPGAGVPAHEFHHAALENLDGATRFAYRMRRGQGIDGVHDGIVTRNVLAGFSHLRSTARAGNWARRFVAFVRAAKRG
ncbi:MAG: cobyrinate a,c-diamide synthase [Alphaproteobacteria bacterium]|nr:cobyrinate a,c-diamide synthase [Alphaproteobacteria bacterium]